MRIWEEITRQCEIHGFVTSIESDLFFDGIIESKRFGIRNVRLEFQNKEGCTYPKAKITSSGFPSSPFPHVENISTICYIEKTESPFNRDAISESISLIVSQIRDTLDLKDALVPLEFYREFRAYWDPNTGDKYHAALIDASEVDRTLDLFEYAADRFMFCGKRCEILQPLSPQAPEFRGKVPLIHLHGEIDLRTLPWPPEHPTQVIRWLKKHSGDAYQSFKSNIIDALSSRQKSQTFVFKIVTASTYSGITVHLPNISLDEIHRLASPSGLRNSFTRRPIQSISRFELASRSSEELFARNGGSTVPLSGLNIILVGCGTVGSQIAPLLVRLGAGHKGKLLLQDHDTLSFGNICRHYLGVRDVSQSKSKRLSATIKAQFPFAQIDSADTQVQESPQFIEEFDVIIDATGDKSTSDWISEMVVNTDRTSAGKKILVTTFLYGNAASACTFIRASADHACHSCLSLFLDQNKNILPDIDDQKFIFRSCQDVFVPYPITASITAALQVTTALQYALESERSSAAFLKQDIQTKDSITCWKELEIHQVPRNPTCKSCGTS